MDESLRELVSRYADGDLDDAGSSRLKARAETDPELEAEIDTFVELRAAVRTIADRMEPPAALDRVMEPLRQAPPAPTQRTRPVYRWLGIAAAVVLGVIVATEMARRNPTPTQSRPSPQRDRPVSEREEIFKLAPLPTAVPDDNRPLGAADHLLKEEPAIPAAPEPAPLEVMGPLSTAAPFTTVAESVSPVETRSATEVKDLEFQPSAVPGSRPVKRAPLSRTENPDEVRAVEGLKRDRVLIDDDRESGPGKSTAGKLNQNPVSDQQKKTAILVLLEIDDLVVWTGSSSGCQAGRWPVQIEVRGSVIWAVEPIVVGREDNAAPSCTTYALVGSSLEGVSDGVYLGELVVGESPR